MKVCYIFGACGGIAYTGAADKFIIAADGGYEFLRSSGITPDLAVGDFDSLGYIPEGTECRVYPSEKDDTDTMLAVKAGFERGCEIFVIYGGIGGRLEHTAANIQTLSYIAQRGARGYLVGNENIITVISDGISFSDTETGFISVFAVKGMPEVSICGLKYTVDRKIMDPAYPIGISNEFIGTKAEIRVSGGLLMVMWDQNFAEYAESVGI